MSMTSSQRRTSVFVENIPLYEPKVRTPVNTRLDSCTRFSSVRYVSTAISPAGSLAACVNNKTVTYVRIFSVSEITEGQKLRVKSCLELRKEEVLDIALSDELLVVLTYGRMLVYEHQQPNAFQRDPLDEVTFEISGNSWIPLAVSIVQSGSVTAQVRTTARVVVGGEGNEARVFSYTHLYGWNRRRGRAELVPQFSQRSGFLKLVGFSPADPNRPDQFMVVGVSTANYAFCWSVDLRQEDSPSIECGWKFDCSPYRHDAAIIGSITSATLFTSPYGKPYLFCTVNQKCGSPLLRSFISPIDMINPTQNSIWDRLRVLPNEKNGGIAREVLHGTISPNGLFIIAVEDGRIRVLAIQGWYKGGLTCRKSLSDDDATCNSPLKDTDHDVSAMSISVKEEYGRLEVVAADGRGQVIQVEINVRDMPRTSVSMPPRSLHMPVSTPPIELAHSTVGELSSGESSRRSGSSASREPDEAVDATIIVAR